MSHPHFEDEDRDSPRRPSRSSSTPTALIVVGGLLIVVLVACAGGVWWLLGFQRQRDVQVADERIAAAVRAEQQRLAGEKVEGVPDLGPAPRVVGDLPRRGRAEFEAAVRGKTREQVVAAVGPPDDVQERVYVEERPPGRGGPGTGTKRGWFADWLVYRGRVTDDATGRAYAQVRVRFGPDGKADRIEYP